MIRHSSKSRFDAVALIFALALGLEPAGCLSATAQSTNAQAMASTTATATPSPATTNAPPSNPRDYAAFKIVNERNIFNANRAGRSSGPPKPAAKPTRVDNVALVGVMSYGQGPVAFFDGSSSSLKKAVRLNDSLDAWKVTEINTAGVKLETGGKTLALRVGSQLRREDDGDWKPVERSDFAASSGASASGDAAGSTSSGGSSESDILKRMMEKREKEL